MNPIYPSGLCKELEPYIDPPSANQDDLVDANEVRQLLIDMLLIPTIEKSIEELEHLEKLHNSYINAIKNSQPKSNA